MKQQVKIIIIGGGSYSRGPCSTIWRFRHDTAFSTPLVTVEISLICEIC